VSDDKPEFVGNRPRTKRVELEDHVKYKGKVYTALTVRRLSTSEVAAWSDAVSSGDPDANLGNVVDDDGEVVPREVLEFMDDDDDEKVSEAIASFLPRRLSTALASDSETQT